MTDDLIVREAFDADQRAQLEPWFTNTDLPVFGLVNLPETVKGAMFARYSRYQGTLRQMFLDEFAQDMDARAASIPGDVEGDRAAALYERIFLGYGDDSVAQLGGAHVAMEWVSNVLTKVLQRGRLAAYLEQSTRYIAYDAPMQGVVVGGNAAPGYRYYRGSDLGPAYEETMDFLFSTYSQSLPKVQEWVAGEYPAGPDEDASAHARAVKAKSLDLMRGLLPASSLSHMGMFASGQAYESLLLHLFASPLPEAHRYGEMLLGELQKIIPSFVQRIERPDRGGRWIDYLKSLKDNSSEWADKLGIGEPQSDTETGPYVRLLSHEGDERRLATALLFEAGTSSESDTAAAVANLDHAQLSALLSDLVGERENRRHRPGRGYESLSYRFEIVSDYGAFRDLQRHRMLTCQWQSLSPHLGAEVPEELDAAGVGDAFRTALEASRAEYERLSAAGLHDQAPYALSLAYRLRYILDLNAREAMQLIELRSGREGHPSYRAVAHAMWDQINAVTPAVAGAMIHVDREMEPRLERLMSEIRNERRATAAE
ncbi:MAG: FAD-dependent thymidylate synthase [Thermoleophilaceae bacterium]|nr:FAD-dependent thymidylate synthase [Thermoleophilaceae bacterium]